MVDDSVVIRRLVTHALEEDPRLEVVGAAANGAIALERIPQLNPDVLTLDIEMPEMDGLETLRRIRRDYPQLRVIMFSTLTERGAAITLDALSAGRGRLCHQGFKRRFARPLAGAAAGRTDPAIKQFFQFPEDQISCKAAVRFRADQRTRRSGGNAGTKGSGDRRLHGRPGGAYRAPAAIAGRFPLPILVVQHMPPLFTRFLAERLNANCKLPVAEAKERRSVEAGNILIAPGDFHMKLTPASAMRIGTPGSIAAAELLPSCRRCALFTRSSECTWRRSACGRF